MSETCTLPEFMERFQTEDDCVRAVAKARWPNGFICPACGHDDGYQISSRPVIQCAVCDRQASVTAGTIFHKTRIPLRQWFLIIFLVAQDKGGASALRLSKLLKMRYDTVWHILHKIRTAMKKDDEAIKLTGYIEIDEGFFGGITKGRPGRGSKKKVPVLVMVESFGRRAGYLAMQALNRVNMDNIRDAVGRRVLPRQHFRSDGWQAYAILRTEHKLDMGPIPVESLDHELHWVHIAISLAKRFIMGTYHGVSGVRLQSYLDEFCYRFNRRRLGTGIFFALLSSCSTANPTTYTEVRG